MSLPVTPMAMNRTANATPSLNKSLSTPHLTDATAVSSAARRNQPAADQNAIFGFAPKPGTGIVDRDPQVGDVACTPNMAHGPAALPSSLPTAHPVLATPLSPTASPTTSSSSETSPRPTLAKSLGGHPQPPPAHATDKTGDVAFENCSNRAAPAPTVPGKQAQHGSKLDGLEGERPVAAANHHGNAPERKQDVSCNAPIQILVSARNLCVK
jgi:hypothetical protein